MGFGVVGLIKGLRFTVIICFNTRHPRGPTKNIVCRSRLGFLMISSSSSSSSNNSSINSSGNGTG